MKLFFYLLSVLLFYSSCSKKEKHSHSIKIYQTNAEGEHFKLKDSFEVQSSIFKMELDTTEKFQTIIGFGGAFTESSSHLISKLNKAAKNDVLGSYFSDTGANYSLVRTHINSCDFSLKSYAYDTVSNDTALIHFSIEEDLNDIIPILKAAQDITSSGFKILASPWTAPPWMKDNTNWFGGRLLKKYYSTWAKYFVKYALAYSNEGIDIWGFTIENEPLGNGENWESMHFSPNEMGDFVKEHLGPILKSNNMEQKLFIFDQNKGEELEEYTKTLLRDSTLLSYIDGTAVHWYASTFNSYESSLNTINQIAPMKSIIHSEACIDAEIPQWKNDRWYWAKEATDWGWEWAPQDKKKDHPKYAPVYRYANDIINCMNNQVSAWIDWNMVLDRQGGPNHAKNWCIAPVIVDTVIQEVYKTPLYYVMRHFSQFVRPDARRIGFRLNTNALNGTAFINKDKSIIVVLFNPGTTDYNGVVKLGSQEFNISIDKQAIQTILLIENKSKHG